MARVIFDYGEVVRARNTYTDPSTGVVTDPTTVQVEVRSPDGTTATYLYGTDVELTKVSTGVYQMLIQMAQTGTYRWYWTAGTADGPSVDYDECDSERKF